MLLARGDRTIGTARMRWAVLFASRVWSVVVDRSGLVLDTRFIPAARDAAPARLCVYVLLSGSWTIHGKREERLVAPCAFVVSEEQLEGARGRRPYTFAAGGAPFRAIEIHVSASAVRLARGGRPVLLDLSARAFDAANALLSSTSESDSALERNFATLLRELVRAGVIGADVAAGALRPSSRPVARIWSGVRPMVERLYLRPTLQEVQASSGFSTRQIDRHVGAFVERFGLVGTRWRSSLLHLRLKLAVLLLSADDVSIAEIARIVGYGSSDAMARSFRDAGLPTPGAVHDALTCDGSSARVARRARP
jgi:AraC-like DNA-binding protein